MADTTTQQGDASGWPGGWYVYDSGRVDGPYSADEAFRMEGEATDGKPRLVSRKGFTQWYALKDLSEIFKMTERMGRHAAANGLMSEAQLAALLTGAPASAASSASAPMSAATASAPMASAAAGVKVQGKQLKAKQKTAARAASHAAAVEAREAADGFNGAVAALSTSVGAAALPEQERQDAAVKATNAPAKSPSAAAKATPAGAKAAAKRALMQEYFLGRGRLRLGKLRNPWLSAFVGLPLTLGVLWVTWFSDAAREVNFHAKADNRSPLPPAILALVPFVHIWMIYKLATQIAEMEAQNRYHSVKPALAAALAIVPPFAMAYLQEALNRHWLLHAKHGVVKKGG